MATSNDKYMVYDLDIHTYRFTNVLIEEKLNIKLDVELNGSKEADAFREDVMYFIKDFCINYTNSWDYNTTRQQIEWTIFNNSNGEREYLQRAYVEVVRYAINDEGDLVGIQSGVNTINGTITPIDELRGSRELSGRLERILRISGLLFIGNRAWLVPTEDVYGTDY